MNRRAGKSAGAQREWRALIILTQELIDRHPTAKPGLWPSGPAHDSVPLASTLSSSTSLVHRKGTDGVAAGDSTRLQSFTTNAMIDAILAEADFWFADGELSGDFLSRCRLLSYHRGSILPSAWLRPSFPGSG